MEWVSFSVTWLGSFLDHYWLILSIISFWWYFDVAGILLDPPETWLDVAINLYDLDTYLDPRSPDADAQRSLNAAETGDVDVEAPPPQKKIVRNKIWWL